MPLTAFVIDDDPETANALARKLEEKHFAVRKFHTTDAALLYCGFAENGNGAFITSNLGKPERFPDIVVTASETHWRDKPSHSTGFDVLRQFKDTHVGVVLVTKEHVDDDYVKYIGGPMVEIVQKREVELKYPGKEKKVTASFSHPLNVMRSVDVLLEKLQKEVGNPNLYR